MSGHTKIEWTDATWNPVSGCSKVSAGCCHCYAHRMSRRLSGRAGYDKDEPFRVTVHRDRMDEPLHWRKPRRVFTASMGDLFHEDVPLGVIGEILTLARATPRHTFLFLTKRPARMRNALTAWDCNGETNGIDCRHMWFGVSVENQSAADERIPILLDTPAAVRFISAEPLLGPVNLTGFVSANRKCFNAAGYTDSLDWVIAGGESGPGARPMHPEWARGLRDQCVGARVPYFFKQWGEWIPNGQAQAPGAVSTEAVHLFEDGQPAARVGKKAAGRLLDGREWSQFPQ